MKKRRENKSHIEDLPEIDIIDLDQESLEEGLNLSGTDDVFTDPIQEPDSQDEEEEYLPLADTEEDTEEAAGADPAGFRLQLPLLHPLLCHVHRGDRPGHGHRSQDPGPAGRTFWRGAVDGQHAPGDRAAAGHQGL